MRNPWNLLSALGFIYGSVGKMTPLPHSDAIGIFGILIGLCMVVHYFLGLQKGVKLIPRYGRINFSPELIVQVINDTDYQITIDKFGFIHGWFNKYRIINLGVIAGEKDINLFLPLKIDSHNSKEIIARINQFDWEKETKKIRGVYVETSTDQIFKGKNRKFNQIIEHWKSHAKGA